MTDPIDYGPREGKITLRADNDTAWFEVDNNGARVVAHRVEHWPKLHAEHERLRAENAELRSEYESARRENDELRDELPDLLEALGWQDGTIHDAIAEVRRMKAQERYATACLGATARTREQLEALKPLLRAVRDLDAACSFIGPKPTDGVRQAMGEVGAAFDDLPDDVKELADE